MLIAMIQSIAAAGGQPAFKQHHAHPYTNNSHMQFNEHNNNNRVDFTSILKTCSGQEALRDGKAVHAHIIKCRFDSDISLGSLLVNMYAKCKSLEDAWKLFDRMSQRNKDSWNSMISGYAQNGEVDKALQVFHEMQLAGEKPNLYSWTAIITGYAKNGHWNETLEFFGKMQLENVKPNTAIFSSVVHACAKLEALEEGKQIHGLIIRKGLESDVYVGTSLVDMYGKCLSIENACQVFGKMSQRNVVSWNAMIAGYAQNGYLNDALELFNQMQLGDIKPNLITWTTLISGYAQNAKCDEALKLFSDMQLKSLKPGVISWTAIITGYAQNGHGRDALKLFQEMLQVGVEPNSSTIAGVLRACTDIVDLQQGKVIHGYTLRRGFQSDVFVGSALLDMYAKCGSINNALLVFDKMPDKNVVSWNSIIAGYALSGHIDDALKLFVQMQLEGPKPDAITWTAIISGYVWNGEVEKASKFFYAMQLENHKPSISPWSAVIAGYAHNGQGDKALDLFIQMQEAGLNPNSVSIASALPACASLAALKQGKQIHGYSIRREFLSDVVVGTALVDMYAKCGSIKDACQVFNRLPERNVVTWNSMITGHSQHGNGKDALLLLHQMIQEGIKPDSITFAAVLSACSRSGLQDEGLQYFDNMSQDYGITPNAKHYARMVDLLLLNEDSS